jgi:proteasome lid subunit RPN8/RPN11
MQDLQKVIKLREESAFFSFGPAIITREALQKLTILREASRDREILGALFGRPGSAQAFGNDAKIEVPIIEEVFSLQRTSGRQFATFTIEDLASLDEAAIKHGLWLIGLLHTHREDIFPSNEDVVVSLAVACRLSLTEKFRLPRDIFFFILSFDGTKLSCYKFNYDKLREVLDSFKPVEYSIRPIEERPLVVHFIQRRGRTTQEDPRRP